MPTDDLPSRYHGKHSRLQSPVVFAIAAFIVVFAGAQIAALFIARYAFDRIDASALRLAVVIMQGITLALTLAVARFQPLAPAELFRLRRAPAATCIAAIVGVFGLLCIIELYVVAQEVLASHVSWLPDLYAIRRRTELTYAAMLAWSSPMGAIAALTAGALIPPICEELFMRGLVQRSLERGLAPMGAILISAALFGLIHFQVHNMIPLTAIGAYLGFIAWRTRSIIPSMLTHSVFNAVMLVMMPAMIRAGSRRLEPADLLPMIPFAVIGTLVLAAALRFITRRHPLPIEEVSA